jgi:dinuclear metal center YbgI/SA1388 family protein
MVPKVKDIVHAVEKIAPPHLAENWDNCGLQIGDPEEDAGVVFVCLDLDGATIEEALAAGADMVLTHHPLIFSPVKQITADNTPVLYRAIREGLAVYSAHTSYDSVVGGVSDVIADKLGARIDGPLAPAAEQGDGVGIGRLCSFDEPVPRDEFLARVKSVLGLETLRIAGAGKGPVKRIAVCGGSGGSLLQRALNSGVESYITGDLKYSSVREFAGENIIIVDAGHFPTESVALPELAEKLAELLQENGFENRIELSGKEEDPFRYE